MAHLRDLLMAAGALPVLDRQTTLFEAWVRTRLTAVTDVERARLLRQFATWHLLPKMHAAARRAPLTAGTRHHADAALTQAEDLLGWLAARDIEPSGARQLDIDTWHTEHPDRAARGFPAVGHQQPTRAVPAPAHTRHPHPAGTDQPASLPGLDPAGC